MCVGGGRVGTVYDSARSPATVRPHFLSFFFHFYISCSVLGRLEANQGMLTFIYQNLIDQYNNKYPCFRIKTPTNQPAPQPRHPAGGGRCVEAFVALGAAMEQSPVL
jgi:hypothetical protein